MSEQVKHWKREGNLLYTLMEDDSWRGQPSYCNELMVRFEADRRVAPEKIEQAIALFLAAEDMLTVLEGIKACELKHDENGHAYLKVPARSMYDLGALVTHVVSVAKHDQRKENAK